MAELSINDIIRINTSISPTGLIRKVTGRTLLLESWFKGFNRSEVVRSYSSIEQVAEDFPADGSGSIYPAALIYFAQEPYPKNLLIGNFSSNASSASIVGRNDVAVSNFNTWSAIIDGSFNLKLNGAPIGITGCDFSAVASMADVATVIDGEIGGDNLTCSWSDTDGAFTFSSDDTGSSVTIEHVTAGTLGTDISEMLALREEDSAYITDGTDTQTIDECLNAIKEVDSDFTFICPSRYMHTAFAGHLVEIADWCAANEGGFIACLTSYDTDDLVSTDETTDFYQIHAGQNSNAFGTYSTKYDDYVHMSVAARLSAVNFNSSNSLITMNMKQLPLCTPEDFTKANVDVLDGRNINRYITRSGVPMYETGITFNDNYWIDTKYWIAWFEDAVRSSVFNLLYSSAKIPQTEAGMTMIKQVIESVCEEGVRNGGIAGGTVSAAIRNDISQSTGNPDFDGVLAKGYFVYSEPMATQPQSERVQRKATPIKVWLKGSGAIQSVDIAAIFEQ